MKQKMIPVLSGSIYFANSQPGDNQHMLMLHVTILAQLLRERSEGSQGVKSHAPVH